MRKDILSYFKKVCAEFKLSLNYYGANGVQKHDIYSLHLNGRAVLNVTEKSFYDLLKSDRDKHFRPLIRVGMAANLGEEYLKDQIFIPRNMGRRLIERGIPKYAI